MNWFILGAFVVFLTSRVLSETIGILPKAVDLIDLPFIPIVVFLALLVNNRRNVDWALHRRIFTFVLLFVALWSVSYFVNIERVHMPVAVLYMFGILEGPVLYLSLNMLIRDKEKFSRQVARFIYIMVLVESAAVVFVNFPMFLATKNPDLVSGTFGHNPYQFSAFLIIMGGFFLGRIRNDTKSRVYGVAIQGAIFITFLFLQYRIATPAFFISYAVVLVLLFGRQVARFVGIGFVLSLLGATAFAIVLQNFQELKFDDFATLAQHPEVFVEAGRVQSYLITGEMFMNEPGAVAVGTGPGTYVSRANYMFTYELNDRDKGVGNIIKSVFGDQTYYTDVQMKYMEPLKNEGEILGSVQLNSPLSSVLAAMAEMGLLGLALVTAIYATVIRQSVKYLRFAQKSRDELLLPLATALVMGALYLVQLALLDNYLEIARVTLPVWLLFWTVSTLVQLRTNQARREALFDMWASGRSIKTVAGGTEAVVPR